MITPIHKTGVLCDRDRGLSEPLKEMGSPQPSLFREEHGFRSKASRCFEAVGTGAWLFGCKFAVAFALFVLLCDQNANADLSNAVAHWGFDSEGGFAVKSHGEVKLEQAGPRPPEFPDFAKDNDALGLDGSGYLTVEDPGDKSCFDFDNGDEITIESWVNVQDAKDGNLMYVIGKGRTDSPEFARDNQNWALRIVTAEDAGRISFLFATKPEAGRQHWHRWESDAAFGAKTGWHHVAVAYRFGEPDSVRGWIDGQPTDGVWDMGGATSEPPVVDNDLVSIGSARGGSKGNSFNGLLDEVAIHRERLDDQTMASRFHRTGGIARWGPQPEVMPTIDDLSPGRVMVSFAEGWPNYKRWLHEGESFPEEVSRWYGEEFLLPRVPARFDDWGIRKSWEAPLLVRMAADVAMPPGEHKFLLRARGLGRLWVDGQAVARTTSKHRARSNLEPIEPVAEPPVLGARPRGFAQQETFGVLRIGDPDDASCVVVRVILELIVGGPQLRTETAEVCVAYQKNQQGPFLVLTPAGVEAQNASDAESGLAEIGSTGQSREVRLEDAVIEPTLAKIERSLRDHEDQTRRAAAATMNDFWEKRHEIARQWASAEQPADARNSEVETPEAQGEAIEYSDSIDRFLAAKIQHAWLVSARQDPEASDHFYDHVLPILRDHCFRCHGDKQQGELRLDSREQILLAGESGSPAVVPGDPESSELIQQIRSGDMPPTEQGLSSEQINVLENWVTAGAVWPDPPIDPDSINQVPIVDDASFLRRAYLDVVGVPPSESEAKTFLSDASPSKRRELIDRLLVDDRYADHWVTFWMDLLAENPTLLNASLNSTGPFRWFLHDALRDDKPLDRLVTELILMRGSAHDGGSSGFALAGENDAPMAEKAHILASSLLGIELQCARCHDSPYHSTTQQDLFSLAAMLNRKAMTPPQTSRVPDEFFENKSRESLIQVSLPLGQAVKPQWPFADVTGVEDGPQIDRLMGKPTDDRERLAALVTGPENRRFPRVMVNHLWKRLIGTGIVEPVHDWEGHEPSHPELLDWLAGELVMHQYDTKHLLRLIMNSELYQRRAIGENRDVSARLRFFNAPDQRRLTAEQIVDSLFVASGRSMDVEELTFVHDGVHPMNRRLTLGIPTRAWMMASLNNERDRPSLSLPRAQPIADVLQAFGWTGSRQRPIPQRDLSPNVLQPGILANGTLTMSLTRASYGSPLAELAVAAESPESLLDVLFLRFLARYPSEEDRTSLVSALSSGFDDRLVPIDFDISETSRDRFPQVTWTNHLVPEANEIQLEIQSHVLAGPPADPRLRNEWRMVYEDVVWSLINHRDFVWVP